MPFRDKAGTTIAVGDTVMIEAVITQLVEGANPGENIATLKHAAVAPTGRTPKIDVNDSQTLKGNLP